MTRRLFLATLPLLVPAAAAAHPGHSHKVLGTIARVDGRKVTVTGTDGKAVTFEVTNRTKLVRDPKTRGMMEELKAGMRAVVTLGEGEEANVATELRYSEKK
jgi:antitoxin component of MazEF toxin-antitoxin module